MNHAVLNNLLQKRCTKDTNLVWHFRFYVHEAYRFCSIFNFSNDAFTKESSRLLDMSLFVL